MTTKELENYEPKGQLIGFPKEIIARMLECQVEQGNKRDVSVFERNIYAALDQGGFDWDTTIEKGIFWSEVISANNLKLFFKKYQKRDHQQDNSQEFRVGDKVIDIILDLKGKIINIKSNGNLEIQFEGKCGLTEYNLKLEKRASLLHYRDDYDYSVIDFNDLPKRPKRWRAEEGQRYYYIDKLFEVSSFMEENHITDTKLYNLGNYFQTKKEAQEVVDIIKKCVQELINKSF